ncbi:ABC transporter ATP-binding protein [Cellvibrio sp. PSBB006]|uniref:ABC transporter ATP-binding protein n=1 Tax=Cellvibrio sp. PSBB006 TaxID=1987723 RepID=UPI000B3BA2D9|nr:ABC transporter ATP-binding protein [Cellvibrio sp. PSBB006]ARU29629.1 ABC transporter ATP-binding protein [Cellvibrio sp. PSBB006]
MRLTTASHHIAIETRGLTRRFGDFTAVDNLDLTITTGTIYGFLGPNGCGKSTSMRLITGLLTPTSGSVQVLGMAIPDNAESLRLRIGYMTQKFSLYEDLSVEENLRFMAQIYNLDTRATKARIAAQLAEYGLDQRRHRLAGSLSGGQRQRLALAAATLHQPELLILDEPTSAVDPENRRDFWEKLFDLCDQGATILVSTHYMDEAERCHGLAILEAGIKRADGAPATLMRELGAQVIEIDGADLRQLKQQLTDIPEVVSAAQQGTHLRVLIRDTVTEPDVWFKQVHAPLAAGREIHLVRPSLEDVFVHCTGEGRRQ